MQKTSEPGYTQVPKTSRNISNLVHFYIWSAYGFIDAVKAPKSSQILQRLNQLKAAHLFFMTLLSRCIGRRNQWPL